MRKNQQGFELIIVILVIVVIGLMGTVGWLVLNRHKDTQNTATQNSGSKVVSAKDTSASTGASFALPNGWKWYENSDHKVKVAYPLVWETSSGFPANLEVINESDAKVYQGCSDPACAISYDATTKKWSGQNDSDSINPVASNSKSEAYLIPIKGEMYCGSYGLYIHSNTDFVHSILSLCEKNDDPNFQPKDGVLSYESVVQDLSKVLDSVTSTK
jgi:type II secretory pathway pseudopilin PulG